MMMRGAREDSSAVLSPVSINT